MNGELMGIGKTYSIKLSLGNFLGALISKNPTKFRLLASEFSLTPITTVEHPRRRRRIMQSPKVSRNFILSHRALPR